MHNLCHSTRSRMAARPISGKQQSGDTWEKSLQALLVHDESETIAFHERFLRREIAVR